MKGTVAFLALLKDKVVLIPKQGKPLKRHLDKVGKTKGKHWKIELFRNDNFCVRFKDNPYANPTEWYFTKTELQEKKLIPIKFAEKKTPAQWPSFSDWCFALLFSFLLISCFLCYNWNCLTMKKYDVIPVWAENSIKRNECHYKFSWDNDGEYKFDFETATFLDYPIGIFPFAGTSEHVIPTQICLTDKCNFGMYAWDRLGRRQLLYSALPRKLSCDSLHYAIQHPDGPGFYIDKKKKVKFSFV